MLHLLEISLLSTTNARIKSSNFSHFFKKQALNFKKDLKTALIIILILELIFDYFLTISIDRLSTQFNEKIYKPMFLSIIIIKKIFVFIFFKNLALSYCNSIAIIISNVLYPIFLPLKPIGKIIGFFTNLFIRPFENKEHTTIDNKIKEIILMLEDDSNYLEEVEAAQYFLGLRELQVQQIMIPIQKCGEIEWNDDQETFQDEMSQLLHHDYVIVWTKKIDMVIGIIDVKDYLIFLYRKDNSMHSLLHKPKFITSTIKADNCLKWIKRDNTDVLCVVNSLGSICGLVTFEDISKRIFQYNEDNNIIKLSDKVLILGNCNIRSINRKMHWNIPKDYTSISGLFFDYTVLPEKNTKICIGEYEFTILEVNQNKIIKTTIRKIDNPKLNA